MKLDGIQVTNYRNVVDSNVVEVGSSTCFVGKNEAGKTAFLKAIEGLRSTNPAYKQFNKTENYPRRYLADYDQRHPDDDATVIRTAWTMSDEDVAAIEGTLGKGTIKGKLVEIKKKYESAKCSWTIQISEAKALAHLINRFELTDDEKAALKDIPDTAEAAKILEAAEPKSERQTQMLATIKKYRDNRAYLAAIDILETRTPKFLYFSHYDRMSGEISINQLNENKKAGRANRIEDQLFLDFLEYAGTTLDELTQAKKFEELNAKCEAAANRITDQIFEYWTQNDELEIKVLLTEGKPEDPAPFNAGPVARARVENRLHRVTVPFSERSAGFIWFFSFLVKFAQIKKQQSNVIILLDEPGLTLHGTAQKDLLRYFKEQLAPHHQLLYTAHSPFMVPPDNLPSVRTVEDVETKDDRGRKHSQGTKVRADVLATDPQTNFPILGAMGFEITQTLVIGENTLLVEGPSDILYLQAASSILKKQGRAHLAPQWAIFPSGGIDKILPFVRLFYGNKLNVAVLTDFERGQKRKLEDLYKSALLANERIILATDIAGKDEADVEDFFEPEFFVDLVNKTYELAGKQTLTVDKLMKADEATKRLVKKFEAYFRVLPPEAREYSHYDPALFLLQNPGLLEGKEAYKTKSLDRFEVAFAKIAPFVK